MQLWLQVWDPSRMVEEVKLPLLPDNAARATPTVQHHAKLLAVKHAMVADTQLKVMVLDDADRPLESESEITQIITAAERAFRDPV
jgi:hypothetical protein